MGYSGQRSRRPNSPSTFARCLAVIGVASLIMEAATLPGVARTPVVASMLVAVALLALVGIALNLTVMNAVIGIVGVGLLAARVGLHGVLTFVALTLLLGWLLGAMLRSRP